MRTMPTLTRELFTARLKGKLFSIASEETFDPEEAIPYSVVQESRFLVTCFKGNARRETWSFLDDKNIHVKSGSKMLVQRDKEGKILAIIVVPSDGKSSPPSEILSAISSRLSKFDTHSISSSCTMRLD